MPPAQQQYQKALLEQKIFMVRCKEMEVATIPVLKLGFDHPEPTYRYAACLAVGKKGMEDMVDKLIERLDDDNVYVQQVARAALVKISKGQDFGPLPGCKCEQVQGSVKDWQDWFAKGNVSVTRHAQP